jgi:hypothetical protein
MDVTIAAGGSMDVFGLFGFMFGLIAFAMVTKLQKDVEQLRTRIDSLPGDSK